MTTTSSTAATHSTTNDRTNLSAANQRLIEHVSRSGGDLTDADIERLVQLRLAWCIAASAFLDQAADHPAA